MSSPSYTPEMRQDRITNQWIALAPSRGDRPKRTAAPDDGDPEDNRPVEGCPFCPGNEELLPSVLWELDDSDVHPWRTRSVPNKFPAFSPDREGPETETPLSRSRPSQGTQEVIIETPRHRQHLGQMRVEQVDAVLQTYLERYTAMRESDHKWIPFVFRNHGRNAGASIEHPHSQLIAIPYAPPSIKDEETQAHNRYEETGRCPYCLMIEEELTAGVRVVWKNDAFVAFVPYAAHVPYETWILPREHEPEFGRLTKPHRHSLAQGLRTVLARLRKRLNDPDYNFFVRTALEHNSEAPHLHWHLRIRPRTTMQAGFEQSTGLRVNPSIPERDAAVLREEE